MTTIKTSNLGFPRLGRKREWKKAIENYWAHKIDKAELDQTLTYTKKIFYFRKIIILIAFQLGISLYMIIF